MIPFISLTQIHLGPITIYVWGLFVAAGIVAGAWAAERLATRRGFPAHAVWDVLTPLVVGGVVGARLFHVLFYNPAYFIRNPLEVFALWHGGMSITGGLIGAVLLGLWAMRKRGLDVWRFSDTLAFGLPLGQMIGRIGCFLTHMHPGTPTEFILGVRYPDGVIRHDHGLYLSLNGLLLFLVFLFLATKRVREGTFLAVFLIWDGAARFGLDFLRAYDGPVVDERYFGLTPAQYVAVAMIVLGLILVRRRNVLYSSN